MAGCDSCDKCYNGCKCPFPEEYIEGGAENCKNYNQEKDWNTVLKNIDRKCDEIRKKYALKGIYL